MTQLKPDADNTVFDSLGAFQRLKAAGMPEAQAQVLVDIIRGIVEDKLATKRDSQELETRMAAQLTTRLAESKVEMIKWTAGILVIQATVVIAALVKFL
jgi:hypothetical protein